MIDDFKKPDTKPVDSTRPADPLIETTDNSKPYNDEILLPGGDTASSLGSGTFGAADDSNMASAASVSKTPKQPKTVKLFGKWTVQRRKLLAVVAVLVLAFGGGGVYAFVSHDKTPATKVVTTQKKQTPPPAPAPIVSPLTGVTVTAEQTKWPVIGVMIENSGDARPQSGLKNAGVVFEAIAEAGITRFLALYQEDRPGNVGPIRSSRPYYLDWAMAFDAPYAHVGGSPDALQRIKDIGVKDLDQFYNSGSYHRITSRYAPHNVYTGVQNLVDAAAGKGWTTSAFTPWARKADKPYVDTSGTPQPVAKTNSIKTTTPTDSRAVAKSIDLSISGAYYNAHYDYDAASNTYKRSEGGEPHMDADTNTQLAPKVVISLVMPYSLMADGYHSQYNTTGTGKAYVFQDGTVTTGSWTKGDPKTQFEFKDDAGKVLPLNAGQTWISVVSDPGKVTYQ